MNILRKIFTLFQAIGQKAADPLRPRAERGLDTKAPTTTHEAGPLRVSQEAIDLIIQAEIGNQAYYEKHLAKPCWPGAASGITIGFGYDIGYNTPTQIHADWNGLIPKAQLEQLSRLSGVRGTAAKPLVKGVAHISVSYDDARDVFQFRTLARFGALALEAFPGLAKCHPHVQGAILSIVFNRGASMIGDRRTEMRAIKDAIKRGDIAAIPFHIRKMKRLWEGKGLDGLIRRRESEARLIESSL